MASYGFIGCGNMGSALSKAVAKSGAERIYLSDIDAEKAASLAKELGECARVCESNAQVVAASDFLFLAVKPQYMEDMLQKVQAALAARSDGAQQIIVSMAAGISTAQLKKMLGGDYPVIRIMPNTPASVGEGVIIYTPDEQITEEVEEAFTQSLKGAGLLVKLSEKLLDAGGALSGCGPAFVDLFIEGLADGAVLLGVPRKDAYVLAAQMVRGSAALVLESGLHPGVLKDAVCSPGGTTIEGVRVLESGAFRNLAAEAVIAAYEKNERLMQERDS